MKLEPWVIFLDMLGYRDINGEIDNDNKANEFLDFMKTNEGIFNSQNSDEKKEMYKKESFDLYGFYDIQTAFVSDSLIINYKPKDFDDSKITEEVRMMHSANTLFIILNRLQTFIYHCLDKREILIRGGISNKYCFVENNFAFGDGLIEAYLHESKIAIYPRIVLSDEIVKKEGFIKSFNIISRHIYSHDTFLKTDEQGVTFLDYLKFNIAMVFSNVMGNFNTMVTINSFLKVHKELIEKKLIVLEQEIQNADSRKKAELDKVKVKLEWLKNYHNESVKDLVPQFLIT